MSRTVTAGEHQRSTQKASVPDISVILPTRNRAQSLREALERLAAQETGSRFTYEVVVVDNGSTDDTRQVVERLQATSPVPLRYFYEGQRGKSPAMNAGIREARGRIFAFTDDDIVTTPTWLLAFWTCFAEEHADAITGKIVPLYTAPRPTWLTDEVLQRLAGIGCVDYGDQRLRRRNGRSLRWVGGNLAIRREAVQRIGPCDVRMVRAQDTEYYRRCIRHGLVVVYEPAAQVAHRLGADRMTPEDFRGWRWRVGYYHMYLVPWRKHHVVTLLPYWWYLETLGFLLGWVRKLLTGRPWVERFSDEVRLREAASLWLHRLQLWPRWWLTVLTGRSYMP